ncbi:hypothetical protein [Sulfuriflexus mobilis]|uniref:hypothetical protein n=1 Tax=Sulfuriflexus mobilis TaxID=1811807 RepID=UPI000F832427|nr:hypothetical protein [Sulfuriflexus mobilis]
MNNEQSKQRQLAIKVARSANEIERDALLGWAQSLLEIKSRDIPAKNKAKEAVQLTAKSKNNLASYKTYRKRSETLSMG